jgi:hypothetical protein
MRYRSVGPSYKKTEEHEASGRSDGVLGIRGLPRTVGKKDVERIIILSDQSERSKAPVSLLNELFPECDISIVSGKPKADEHDPTNDPTVKSADNSAYTSD